MATIEREAIRAIVTIGDKKISTPDVISFNVKKARGQAAATFSASLRMDALDLSDSAMGLVAKGIIIEAGIKNRERQIFTGIVQKVTINPIRTDASKVMVSLSGKDLMYKMEGQKINRRVKTYRDGDKPPERWGVVTAIEEDNTPVNIGFGYKTFTRKQSVVRTIDGLDIVLAPGAYSTQDLLRTPPLPTGGITASTLQEEEDATQEGA